MLGFNALKTESTKTTEPKMKIPHQRKIKGEIALKFLFVFGQKLRQIPDDATAETQVTSTSNLIMDGVNRFAPETENGSKRNQITESVTKQRLK